MPRTVSSPPISNIIRHLNNPTPPLGNPLLPAFGILLLDRHTHRPLPDLRHNPLHSRLLFTPSGAPIAPRKPLGLPPLGSLDPTLGVQLRDKDDITHADAVLGKFGGGSGEGGIGAELEDGFSAEAGALGEDG